MRQTRYFCPFQLTCGECKTSFVDLIKRLDGDGASVQTNSCLIYFCLSFFFFPCSNDEIEEGEPGEDSDFEVDAKKEVSATNLNFESLTFYLMR